MSMYMFMYVKSSHLFLLVSFTSPLASERFYLDAKSLVSFDNQHKYLFFDFP